MHVNALDDVMFTSVDILVTKILLPTDLYDYKNKIQSVLFGHCSQTLHISS